MSRPFSTSRTDLTGQTTASRSAPHAPPDPAEHWRRWAELVAVGASPLPADLQPAELRAVLKEVARLRRRRLVHLVARAIAEDVHRDSERKARKCKHAQTRI